VTAGRQREPLVLLAIAFVCLGVSGVRPHDRTTWWLEVAPFLLALPPLAVAWHRGFRFTPLVYRLLLVHAVILMIGGHYTYAEVPIGNWVRDALGLARNHYDRLGHLMQGFVPAIVGRELLLRTSPLRRGRWLFVLVTASCLGISALYELVEWWTAVATGAAATAFLGTQGDPWDTQWDMFCALVGAIVAQLTIARVHDRELAALR